MYWLLFLILCAMTISIYFAFKKDILSPSFIFSFMFTVSILSAIIAQNFWNDVEIGPIVFWIPIISVVSAFCGELVVRGIRHLKLKKHAKDKEKEIKLKRIVVPPAANIAFYIFLAIVIFLLIKEMSEITGVGNNIPEMINKYRTMTPLFNADSSDISISTFLVQLVRVANLLGMFSLFIIINNLLLKDRIKNIIVYAGIVFLASIIMLFVAGRSCLIQYAIFGFGIAVVLRRKTKGNSKKEIKNRKRKTIRLTIASVGIVTILFYLIMPLIGRAQVGGPVGYVTFYLGNPLPSLQRLIDNDKLEHSASFGQESLNSSRGILSKFGIETDHSAYQDTWSDFYYHEDKSQIMASNTFTGMKPYFVDWGWVGVIICQVIFGVVFTILYFAATDHNKVFIYIIYGMFLINVVTQVNSEKMFSVISISNIVYVIYTAILARLLSSVTLGHNNEKEIWNGR